MRLVITEKPSVARDLARVLGVDGKREGHLEGPHLRIAWCFGHMAELEEPAHYQPEWKAWTLQALPMIPSGFDIRVREGAEEQMAVLRRLLTDPATEEVVNGCDAGREGELIFRYVYELAGCRRPVLRLWVSSLTDAAIRAAWGRLRPGRDFDALADAARSRSEADWLVGMNATRALTCSARRVGPGELLSVGRVQTPTLAMLVERDRAIEAFVPEPFWQVEATLLAPALAADPRRWRALWTRETSAAVAGGAEPPPGRDPEAAREEAHDTRLATRDEAEAVTAASRGGRGRVTVARRRRTRERPPLLYDLTSLQRRANQRYGLSAPRTLEIAQALYERHKLITYPRTDARFLTPDQVPHLPDVLRGLQPIAPYAPFVAALLAHPIRPGKRVVDAAEVGDHHAIIPTGRTPRPEGLDNDEKRVFDLVARRLLAALSADAVFDVTLLVVEVPPQRPIPETIDPPLRFRARGRVCRDPGWRAVDPPGPSREIELPAVEVGDPAEIEEVGTLEGTTRPPPPHNDASLLGAMESAGKALDDQDLVRALRKKGLGTPATRAAILQTLLDRGFVERDRKILRATDRGRALIDALPVAELKSAELTGQWEGRLSAVADGHEARRDFMDDIAIYTRRIVDSITAAPPPELGGSVADAGIGACPVCDRAVRERGPVYSCDSGRDCPFVVFGTTSGRRISARMVKDLLLHGRSKAVKGFRSKAGKEFTAGLRWDPEKRKVVFWFPDRVEVGAMCPRCRAGTLIQGRSRLGCSRWREGCDYTSG